MARNSSKFTSKRQRNSSSLNWSHPSKLTKVPCLSLREQAKGKTRPGYLIRSENYITWKVSIIEVSSISSSTWSSLSSPWMTSKADKMNKGTREKARTPLSSNRWRHMPVSPSAISSSRTFSKQKSTLMNIIEWPKRLRLKTQSPTLHITSESFSKRKATEKKPSTIINPTLRQPSHRNLIKKTVNLWIRHE